jgi:hypothetical protein
MAALATVRRTEIDGVPAFWVDSGGPALTAHLQFRTGTVDEILPTFGLTHLVQHLAVTGLPARGDREVGGSTGLLRTTLSARGSVSGVRRFLVDVCEWLDGPDLSRVVSEASVLRTQLESAGRSRDALALLRRYGARGPGLVGFDEPALHGASPNAVRGLVHTWFTRGNAALVLDGPPSEGFRLPLRDGPRRPVPEPPVSRDPRPAAFDADDTMSVSGEVGRTPAASLLPELLQRALVRDLVDLRDPPWATYESVGLVTAVVTAGFRAPTAILDRVVEYTHGAVEGLRRNGPHPQDLAEVVAAAVRRLEDPIAAVRLAEAAASDHLDGRPSLGPGSYRRALTEVTVEDVAEVTEAFSASLLLGVPAGATRSEEVPLLTGSTPRDRPEGRSHRSLDAPADRRRLVVGDGSVHVGRRGTWQGASLGEVAAVLAAPDGGRQVVAADGWTVTLEPTMWRGGDQAVARLDHAVPADRVVRLPERRQEEIPRPGTFRHRWTAVPHLLTGLVVAAAVALLVLALTSGRLVFVAAAVIGGLIVVTLVATRGSDSGLDSAA